MAEIKIHSSWLKVLKEEFDKDYFKKLTEFVKQEFKTATIYPEGKNIFRAFELCPFEEVKVVILGQDPYHGPKQANGLSFSVNEDMVGHKLGEFAPTRTYHGHGADKKGKR